MKKSSNNNNKEKSAEENTDRKMIKKEEKQVKTMENLPEGRSSKLEGQKKMEEMRMAKDADVSKKEEPKAQTNEKKEEVVAMGKKAAWADLTNAAREAEDEGWSAKARETEDGAWSTKAKEGGEDEQKQDVKQNLV